MIHPYFNLTGDEAKGLLFGLLKVDEQQLKDNPGYPSMRQMILEGKVKYRLADPNEHWQSYREMVENVEKFGVAYADCEDLAPAVAAEDRVRYGVMSEPFAYKPSAGLYHVVTAVPTSASQRFGSRSWPKAMGANNPAGYMLQDVSAAAGMGTSDLYGGVRGKQGVGRFGLHPSESLMRGRRMEGHQVRSPHRPRGQSYGGTTQQAIYGAWPFPKESVAKPRRDRKRLPDGRGGGRFWGQVSDALGPLAGSFTEGASESLGLPSDLLSGGAGGLMGEATKSGAKMLGGQASAMLTASLGEMFPDIGFLGGIADTSEDFDEDYADDMDYEEGSDDSFGAMDDAVRHGVSDWLASRL